MKVVNDNQKLTISYLKRIKDLANMIEKLDKMKDPLWKVVSENIEDNDIFKDIEFKLNGEPFYDYIAELSNGEQGIVGEFITPNGYETHTNDCCVSYGLYMYWVTIPSLKGDFKYYADGTPSIEYDKKLPTIKKIERKRYKLSQELDKRIKWNDDFDIEHYFSKQPEILEQINRSIKEIEKSYKDFTLHISVEDYDSNNEKIYTQIIFDETVEDYDYDEVYEKYGDLLEKWWCSEILEKCPSNRRHYLIL